MEKAEEGNSGKEASEILIRDDGRVRIVTLNRPDRINAFTSTSYRKLTKALDDADGDPDVSLVLIEGAGKGFSSGIDLGCVVSEGELLAETFDTVLESLIAFSKPLLAAVHGAAIGFGTTILLHCDLAFVAETARLRLPFTALGTAPEAASSALLPQMVGRQRAADLLLTSRWITGREAAEMGLAARCYPEERLHSEARATAQELSKLPDAALVTMKRLLRAGVDGVTREALVRERAEASFLHQAIGSMGYRE
jgi:enoyl-CoA hydratase/carnithine racemase